MKKLTTLIMKYPVKTLIFTFVIMIGLIIGVTQIELKTGNDTLISDNTDIYQDNEAYQNEFGKDPIVLIFDQETLFESSSLFLMNDIQQNIENLEGIFAINSPVTIINQISISLYNQTENGLNQMSLGLNALSLQLDQLSTQMVSGNPSELPDLEALSTNLGQMITAQDQLNTGLVNMFSILDLLNLAVVDLKMDLNTLKTQIEADPTMTEELELTELTILQTETINQSISQLLLQEDMTSIPAQTSLAISQLMVTLFDLSGILNTQLESIQTLSQALHTMSVNLGNMGTNLAQIHTHFNAFEPGFPSSPETLHMMIYGESSEVKQMFSSFIVNEEQLRMVIVLNGNVTDQQIDAIYETIINRLELEGSEDKVLVSGKPILDRSIKSSMMESMQYMMISAVVIMILILLLIYKVRMRLLPIVMILFAVVATVGMMGWLSIGLTMVSMAVFPVLIGLGIDYFIQFQTRYEEERG
ncbi:putative membrane protein YdfJ with MMPL/SSD domain [Acholeplasma morum]|uniref:MMPL family transporter n=1 Tax=Paracholeplasma morum TaxID=264637 RepID=UPI00195CFF07|nr:MMPL family transporter [Paracholeplasma morum]MBM7453179.1 putative membrane protein YdfJ with MMPL/SSD domain [Paracholeplasma morum]